MPIAAAQPGPEKRHITHAALAAGHALLGKPVAAGERTARRNSWRKKFYGRQHLQLGDPAAAGPAIAALSLT